MIMYSSRPYLIRAVYQWISDNHMKPYLVVDAGYPGVSVPQQHVQDRRIVLNIDRKAVSDLTITNHAMQFNACFLEGIMNIVVPVAAVIALYAKENGRGMVFDDFDDGVENDESGCDPEHRLYPFDATVPSDLNSPQTADDVSTGPKESVKPSGNPKKKTFLKIIK